MEGFFFVRHVFYHQSNRKPELKVKTEETNGGLVRGAIISEEPCTNRTFNIPSTEDPKADPVQGEFPSFFPASGVWVWNGKVTIVSV